MNATTQVTCVTGNRSHAEHLEANESRMRIASHILRLLNDGWILHQAPNGYALTPPSKREVLL